MDSDWVFNFNCTHKPINTSKYYDENIIPKEFYEPVINRNKQELINQFKLYPNLLKAVPNFYYNTLCLYYSFRKTAKFGMPFKIKWSLINDQKITMNNAELVLYYEYITIRKNHITNFGYLLSNIFNYLGLIKQAQKLIKKKENASYYYYLGNNIKNDFQMDMFIRQFIIN